MHFDFKTFSLLEGMWARKCLMKRVFHVRYCPERLRCKIGMLVSAPEAGRMIHFGGTSICDDGGFYCEGPDRKSPPWPSGRLTQR